MQGQAAVNTGAAVAVDSIKAVADSIRAEAVVPARKSAAATFLIGVLRRLEAQFRHNEAALVAQAVLVATRGVPAVTKGVSLSATSKATQKLLTFMLTAISGLVMTAAATMLVTIRITSGNTDASVAKLAATTFIASKAEAVTISASVAFSGAWRRMTMTTLATGCGTATTS
jgi:hypothetical protein